MLDRRDCMLWCFNRRICRSVNLPILLNDRAAGVKQEMAPPTGELVL